MRVRSIVPLGHDPAELGCRHGPLEDYYQMDCRSQSTRSDYCCLGGGTPKNHRGSLEQMQTEYGLIVLPDIVKSATADKITNMTALSVFSGILSLKSKQE